MRVLKLFLVCLLLVGCTVLVYRSSLFAVPTYTPPTTPGWSTIPNSRLDSVGLPNYYNGSGYQFANYFWGIVAYSGAIWDSTRSRMIVWGGGHDSYYGNELYAVNCNALTSTTPVQRLNDPCNPIAPGGTCQSWCGPVAFGQPNSRHTYQCISYIPTVDRMFVFSGALSCQSSQLWNDYWAFNFSDSSPPGAWTGPLAPGGGGSGTFVVTSAYDRKNDRMYMTQDTTLFEYNPYTGLLTSKATVSGLNGYNMAVIDPLRHKLVIIGNYRQKEIDLDTFAVADLGSTGGSALINTAAPGVAYDSALGKIVAWNGGNTVYILDMDTKVWSTQDYTGGPSAWFAQAAGIYGRMQYVPSWDAFVIMNATYEDIHVLKLDNGTVTSLTDFTTRCTAPGVRYCNGFESTFDQKVANWGGTTDADWTGRINPQPCAPGYPLIDTSVKSSGNAALDFPVTTTCGSAGSGEFRAYFQDFNEGETLWYQWRQRWDSGMLDGLFSSYWKINALFSHASPIHGSCEDWDMMTFVNLNQNRFPFAYGRCGYQFIAPNSTSNWACKAYLDTSPPFMWHSSDAPDSIATTGYNANYGEVNNTWKFTANQWTTFMVKVVLGTWNTYSSSVDAYVADDGGQWKKWIHTTNVKFLRDGSAGCNMIYFLPGYMTGRTPDGHPTAHTWVDEIIVSSQQIALPGASGVVSQAGAGARRRLHR